MWLLLFCFCYRYFAQLAAKRIGRSLPLQIKALSLVALGGERNPSELTQMLFKSPSINVNSKHNQRHHCTNSTPRPSLSIVPSLHITHCCHMESFTNELSNIHLPVRGQSTKKLFLVASFSPNVAKSELPSTALCCISSSGPCFVPSFPI